MLSGCVPGGSRDLGSDGHAHRASASATVDSSDTCSIPDTDRLGPVLNRGRDGGRQSALLRSIVAAVWAGPDNVSGRAYIDALVAGGFDKSAMQVTKDQSTVGNPAESIQFSVLWAGECLVGQVGPATGSPVAIVLPPVGADECLIGDTRPIDW